MTLPVIVIGSGLGGHAAAIRLRAMGWPVRVLEAMDQPGGRAAVFRQDGLTFDAGPTVVTASYLFDELFALVGRDRRDHLEFVPVDPFYRVAWADGQTFDYVGDEARLTAQIAEFNPADVDGYRRLADHARRIFDVGYTELVDKPFDRFTDMLKIVPDLLRLGCWRSVHAWVQPVHRRRAPAPGLHVPAAADRRQPVRTMGTNSYSYFSVDGKIENLNLMIGQYLAINGFVGGLSYNMKMRENSPKPMIDAVVDRLIGGVQCSTDAPMSNFPQVPEEGKFQLLFSVLFKDAAAGGFAFNGGMGLFSQIDLERGGVDYLAVGGFMDFIKPPTASLAIGVNDGMKLRASLGLMYVFNNHVLTGSSRVYINVGNVLVGTARTDNADLNEPDLAGKMALYVVSNDWYVYIGNPWAPTNAGDPGNLLASMPQYAEVSVVIPGFNIRLGGAGAYRRFIFVQL